MRKFKKLISFMIVCISILVLFGCSGSEKADVDQTPMKLYEHGLDVVALMNEMINNDDYLYLFTQSKDIYNIISNMRAGDYSSPKAIYRLKIDDNELLSLYAGTEQETIKGFSEELMQELDKKTAGALVSIINGMTGVNNLAASSVCTASKLFVYNDISAHELYLYMYDNALPVVVSFIKGNNGAVEAVGNFLMLEDFKTANEEFIVNYFGNFSVEATAVEFMK